ncbi:hypothetical protein Nepgr_019596 [Nepenthes gracilis]|uniref:Uncharacterized protein n=1 Tax=Nepenthes gracilis TaxID=150966 RepID=A0AAD3SVB9_NEPGR|nr:hypothetical protein Nepgr_019596 [Nepenthes gracilis]
MEPGVNKRSPISDELIEDHILVVVEGREFCSAHVDFPGVILVPEQAEVESDSKELPADVVDVPSAENVAAGQGVAIDSPSCHPVPPARWCVDAPELRELLPV